MQCFCCDRDGLTSARKAKARELFDNGQVGDGKESAAYMAYCEQSAYRWQVICQACYSLMDNRPLGDAWIGDRWFSLAGNSRGDKATTIDQVKYRAWQQREAARLGLDLQDQT